MHYCDQYKTVTETLLKQRHFCVLRADVKPSVGHDAVGSVVAVGAGGEDEALGPVDGVQLGQAEGEDGGAAAQTQLV